jgi:hypothetical protein
MIADHQAWMGWEGWMWISAHDSQRDLVDARASAELTADLLAAAERFDDPA